MDETEISNFEQVISRNKAAIGSLDPQESSNSLDTQAAAASSVSAPAFATSYNMAKELGVSTDAVISAPEEAKRTVEKKRFSRVTKSFAGTTRFLDNPDYARLSSDNLDKRTGIEQFIVDLSDSYEASDEQKNADILTAQSVFRPLTPVEEAYRGRVYGANRREIKKEGLGGAVLSAAEIIPSSLESLKGTVAGGAAGGAIGAVAGSPGGLPGALTGLRIGWKYGAAVGGASSSYMQNMGNALNEFSSITDSNGEKIDRSVAIMAATATAAPIAVLDQVGFGKLAEVFPGGSKVLGKFLNKSVVKAALSNPQTYSALRKAASKYAQGVTAETATEVAQEFIQIIGGELAKNADSTKDFADITPEEIASRLTSTAVTTAQGTAVLGFGGGVATYANESIKKNQLKKQQDAVKKVGEMASSDPLVKNAPDAAEAHIKEVLADHPEKKNVYIPAEQFTKYFQSQNLDPEEVAKQLDVGEQLQGALEVGGDLVVPLEKYYTKIAGNVHHQGLAPDIKFTAGSLSAREIQEIETVSPEAAAASRTEMETIVSENVDQAKQQTKFEESAEKVRRDVEAKLLSAGRSKSEASRAAMLYKARYATKAERRGNGAMPHDLYKQRKIQFEKRKQGVERKGALKQDSTAFKQWFGNSKVVDKSGNPLLVSHGTDAKFDTFEKGDIGFHFGTDQQAAERGSNIGKYYLSLKNPYDIGNDLGDWSDVDMLREYLGSSNEGPLTQQEVNSAKTPQDFVELLKKKGYDGIAYDNAFEGQGQSYIAFDPTQIKSVDNQGTFNPNDKNIYRQDARGEILFGDDETVISFFKNADASTVIHETGHAWLKEIADDVASGQASAQEVADYQKTLYWLGAKDYDSLTTEQIEEFARGWEAYVFEGKAPSNYLERVFRSFRTWLAKIYNTVLGLNVELTDDVRGVFDRMLATDIEIQQAIALPVNQPLIGSEKDAKAAKMSPDAYKAYLDLNKRSIDRAKGEVLAKAVKRIYGERMKSYRQIRKEVRESVESDADKMPVFFAQEWIRKGGTYTDRSGKEVTVERMKLDRSYVTAVFNNSPDVLELIEDKYLSRDGINPDDVASIINYDSGIQLIQDLVNYPDRSEWVETEFNKRLAQQFDTTIFAKDNIEAAAMEAIQNEERFEVLEAELKALATISNQQLVNINTLKEFAKRDIGASSISSIMPNRYLAKANKFATEAQRHFGNKNYAKALDARKRQLANMYLHREAIEARAEYAKGLRYAKKLATSETRRARLGKAMDGFLEQVDALLGRFALTKQLFFPKESLRTWVANRIKDGESIVIPETILDDSLSVKAQDLRFNEFKDLITALRSIEHAVKVRTELKTKDEQMTYEEAEGRILENLNTNFKQLFDEKRGKPRKSQDQSWAGKTGRFIGSVRNAIIKPEFELGRLDGDVRMGTMWKLFYSPINEASKERIKRNAIEAVEFDKVIKPFGNMRFKEKVFIKELGIAKTRGELIAAALNMGNKYNREALATGEQWTQEQLEAVKKYLSVEDWNYVQTIWDYIGKFKPEIAQKSRELTGVDMEFIEAEAVSTPYGTYKGGYYPVKFDSTASSRVAEIEEATDIGAMHAGSIMAPGTVKGFTETRKGTGGRPLLLDPNVMARHVTDVVNFLTVHSAVRQTDRLLQRKNVKEAIETVAGVQFVKNLRQWLLDVANDRPPPAYMEKEVRKLRSNLTVATMAWKFSVAVQQTLGLLTTWSDVKTKYIVKATNQLYNPATRGDILARVWDRSIEVRSRVEQGERDVRDTLQSTTGNEFSDQAKRSFFLVTGLIDREVATITWLAAHYQAADLGYNETQAIDYADQVTRETQASGLTKDLSSIQRQGGLVRLLTMFQSFFNALYGRTEREIRMLKNGKVGLPHFVNFLMLNWIMPAVLAEFISNRAPDEDADSEEWLAWFLKNEISYPFALIPVVGTASRNAIQRFFGGGYSSDSLTVVDNIGSRFNSVAGSIGSVARGDADWGDVTPKMAKDILYLSGYGFGLPASQIDTTLTAVQNALDGDEVYPIDFLLRPNKDARD